MFIPPYFNKQPYLNLSYPENKFIFRARKDFANFPQAETNLLISESIKISFACNRCIFLTVA